MRLLSNIGDGMIFLGILLQVFNAASLLHFLRHQELGVLGHERIERVLSFVVPSLVLFFIPVYTYLLSLHLSTPWVGALLFAGAVFVALVLQWIFLLVENSKTRTRELAQAILGVFDARDPDTAGHSRHVQNLTLLLFDALPSSKTRGINRNDIGYAALFHDIGKLGITDFILQKPGSLTPEEIATMRDHTRIGAEIMRQVEGFRLIADWVLYHHERVDGTGYYGLSAEEIPYASKIIAVADTYSAVALKRAYKGTHDYDECVAVLREAAGTQLDAELVEAFCGLPRKAVLDATPE